VPGFGVNAHDSCFPAPGLLCGLGAAETGRRSCGWRPVSTVTVRLVRPCQESRASGLGELSRPPEMRAWTLDPVASGVLCRSNETFQRPAAPIESTRAFERNGPVEVGRTNFSRCGHGLMSPVAGFLDVGRPIQGSVLSRHGKTVTRPRTYSRDERRAHDRPSGRTATRTDGNRKL